MKSRPILALAALAAFASGVHTSNAPPSKEESKGLFGRLRTGFTGAAKPKEDASSPSPSNTYKGAVSPPPSNANNAMPPARPPPLNTYNAMPGTVSPPPSNSMPPARSLPANSMPPARSLPARPPPSDAYRMPGTVAFPPSNAYNAMPPTRPLPIIPLPTRPLPARPLPARSSPFNALPIDIYTKIAEKFTEKDHSQYAIVNQSSNENVEQFRDKSFYDKILRVLQRYDINLSSHSIWNLVTARTSGNKPYIPLSRFIGKWSVDPLVLQKFAYLALPLATGDANAIMVADPLSLLQLVRAAGPSQCITVLFKQNARRFNNGLGIDITWTKDGFLNWFLSAIDPKTPNSALRDVLSIIKFSPLDLSAISCAMIYSALGSTAQARGSPLTSNGYAAILNQILLQTSNIGANYKMHRVVGVKNPLEQIAPANHPMAFDFKNELNTCFKESPSIFALVAGLDLLLDSNIPNANREQAESNIKPIIQNVMQIGDMNFSDMRWLMFSTWQPLISMRWALLIQALAVTSNALKMKKWLLSELFEQKRYQDMAKVVHVLKRFDSNPLAIWKHEKMLYYLGDTENGGKMRKLYYGILAEQLEQLDD